MTDYEFTRRDALAALASVGVAVTASDLSWSTLSEDTAGDTVALTDHHRDVLLAVADVVYPSAVSGTGPFVESYVAGRVVDDPDRSEGMADALDYLDSYAREWYDNAYLDLSPKRRETALKATGAHVTDPDPEGSDVERLRFYVVNELLYALYTSPTGGELLGLENPQGYPGGTDSYRRGPPE